MARLCGHEDVFPIANPASMVPLQLRTIRQSRHRATEPPPKRFTRCAARRSKRIDRLPTIDGVPSSARFAGDLIAGNHFQGPGIANPRCTFGSAMPFGSCVLATTSILSSFLSTYCYFSYRDLRSSRSARRGETCSSGRNLLLAGSAVNTASGPVPGSHAANLGSPRLGLCGGRVAADWQHRFGHGAAAEDLRRPGTLPRHGLPRRELDPGRAHARLPTHARRLRHGADATGGQQRRCPTLRGSGRNRQPAVQHRSTRGCREGMDVPRGRLSIALQTLTVTVSEPGTSTRRAARNPVSRRGCAPWHCP